MKDMREVLRKRAMERARKKMETGLDQELSEQGDKPCPICGKLMCIYAMNNVLIDVCEEHGVWFDSGELEQILNIQKNRSNSRHRRALQEAKRKGKYSALRWGLWSLLDD